MGEGLGVLAHAVVSGPDLVEYVSLITQIPRLTVGPERRQVRGERLRIVSLVLLNHARVMADHGTVLFPTHFLEYLTSTFVVFYGIPVISLAPLQFPHVGYNTCLFPA